MYTCQCDSSCIALDDCCSDITEVCPEVVRSVNKLLGSCKGHCGRTSPIVLPPSVSTKADWAFPPAFIADPSRRSHEGPNARPARVTPPPAPIPIITAVVGDKGSSTDSDGQAQASFSGQSVPPTPSAVDDEVYMANQTTIADSDSLSWQEVLQDPNLYSRYVMPMPNPTACYCESSCVLHDDCCQDYVDECQTLAEPERPAEVKVEDLSPLLPKEVTHHPAPPGTNSCVGRCDHQYDYAHQCYCDRGCVEHQDCCPDVEVCFKP